jgi:hypothetical protein
MRLNEMHALVRGLGMYEATGACHGNLWQYVSAN